MCLFVYILIAAVLLVNQVLLFQSSSCWKPILAGTFVTDIRHIVSMVYVTVKQRYESDELYAH